MPTAAASLPTDAPLPHAQAASQALDTALAWQLIPDAQTERAEVRFADRELDGLTVQVSVRGDQATVHFGSDNAEHRQIIQSSVHEVQALLNQRGLTLSEARVDPLGSGASVGAGGTGQREPAPPQTQPLVAVNGPADAHRSEPEPLMRAHARAVRGLDLFA